MTEAISEEELKIVLNLAMQLVVANKSAILMVPEYNLDDNAHQRAILLERVGQTEHLEQLGLLIDITKSADFADTLANLREKTKREVKLFLLSPIGLSIYKSHDDVWTDEQKEDYTTQLIQRERDKSQEIIASATKLAKDLKK
jgi:hypothetical protein